MSRDALLYVADMVDAGDADARYVEGVTFEAFAKNDEKACRRGASGIRHWRGTHTASRRIETAAAECAVAQDHRPS